MQKAPLIILFLFVLVTSASADFNAYGDTTINADTCTTTKSAIYIQNTDSANQTFSISVSGEGADLLKFSTLFLELQPGQIAQINTFYKILCDQKEGKYPVTIYFTSQDTEKTLQQKIIVQKPESIDLTTSEPSIIIGPCGIAEYTALLQNPTNITETYDLEILGYEAKISKEYTLLEPSQKEEIKITVEPQDCAEHGEYSLDLHVKAHKTQTAKHLPLTLIIQNQNIPAILQQASTIKTQYITSTVKIPVQNTGSKEAHYNIAVSGPDWVRVQPDNITLRPNEKTDAALIFSPTEETEEGTYQLNFTVTVQGTRAAYDTSFTIKLREKSYLETHPGAGLALGILLVLFLAGVLAWLSYINIPTVKERRRKQKAAKIAKRKIEKQKKLERKQKIREEKRKRKEQRKKERQKEKQKAKQKKQQRKEQLKAARLEHQAKKIQEKKEKQFEKEKQKIKKQVEHEYKDKFILVDKSKLIQGKQSKTGKKIHCALLALLLLFISLFWGEVVSAWKHILVAAIVFAAFLLVKLISRSSLIAKKYKILLAQQKHIKIWRLGLTDLLIEPKSESTNAKIKIKKTSPSTKKGIHYSTFQIEDNIEKINYEGAFKIPKAWLKRKEIPRDNLKLAKLNGQEWRSTPLTQTGEDKKFIYYRADLRQGTYTLYGKPHYSKSKKKPMIAIIASLTIIIALVILSIPTDITTEGIPQQTLKQNEAKTINLEKYFHDPDNDPLEYTATPTEHIKIDIRQGSALITPQQDWIGDEYVRFIASDSKNGTVSSNAVKISVKKSLLSNNAPIYFAIAISLAALIILFFGLKDLKKRI